MSKNLTVGDLKEIMSTLDDNLPVIIPVIDYDDCNCILAFRRVRTSAILEDPYASDENRFALCFNSATDGQDLGTQICEHKGDILCKEVLR